MEVENAPETASEDVIEVSEDERTASTENLTPRQVRKSDCSSTWSTLPSVYALLTSNLIMVIMVFILPVICDGTKSEDNKDGKPVVDKCLVEPFSLLIYRYIQFAVCTILRGLMLLWKNNFHINLVLFLVIRFTGFVT